MNKIRRYINPQYQEGEKLPLFYLPVMRPPNKYALELWPFFLAPFVVIYQIARDAFWCIWRDTMDMVVLLYNYKIRKSKQPKS